MYRLISRQMAAALVVAVGGLSSGRSLVLAQPSVSHVTPGAVMPGQTTEIMLHGGKLDGTLRAWTSFPAHVEFAAADSKQKDHKDVSCKITLSAGCPVGVGGMVVATATGMSDVIFLMIDDLPSAPDNGTNHSAAAAQEVKLPAGIDGQCDGTLADYYRFAARAGERISCEIVAARLGSDFDSVVRVFDEQGHELLLADDDPSTGADTRLIFAAPATGTYLLELRDNRYKPGGRYRLRLGDFPLVSAALPLFAQRNAPVQIDFRGPRVDSDPVVAVLPISNEDRDATLDLRLPSRAQTASGWAALRMTGMPVYPESSASTAATAAGARPPCVFSGVLAARGERDLFSFAGKKGESLRFRAVSRSGGSPAICSLRVLDAAGKQLAEAPVTDSDEPALNFSPAADGQYQLAVEELAGRGGNDFVYAVECKCGPQFSLLLKNDKNNRLRHSLTEGGAFTLDVQCQRAGYDGAIKLGIDSPRPGWQVFNNVIGAKAAEVKLYVTPPIDWSPGELAPLRVVGRAEASEAELVATMATTVQLRIARPQMPYPPSWQDGAIFVSSIGSKPNFYTVFNRENAVKISRDAGQGQVTLDFERTDAKFKDVPLTVLPLGLPTGVAASIKRNGNGAKETYDIVLKGSKALPAGEHVFRYFAYAELAGQGRGVLSGDLRLSIADETPAAEKKTP